MKFVAISDTHDKHAGLSLPEGDVIIHAGDATMRGTEQQVRNFLQWFSGLDYRYKIFIAGNHDFLFERLPEEEVRKLIPENVIYLNDSGVEIEGIKIWGSPIQPWFQDWAFNRQRGADIKKHWDLIPSGTDILITHGPPFGILDRLILGMNVGCEELRDAVRRVNPSVHIFGHIHESYGELASGETRFINAAVLNEDYFLTNEPIGFTFG